MVSPGPVSSTSAALMAERKDRRSPAVPIEIFYSYSHRDAEFRDELDKHLTVLKRAGVITGWHDRAIRPGDEWKEEIDKHLNSARVILLLVSVDFLASDYCWSIEMTRAMERHESGEARVIPIILRSCDWSNAPFRKLQALPQGAPAVTKLADRDDAFTQIAIAIRNAVVKPEEASATSSASGGRIARVTKGVKAIVVPAKPPQLTTFDPVKKKIKGLPDENGTKDAPATTVERLTADLDRYLAPILKAYIERLSPYSQSKIVRDVIWNFNVFQPYELAVIDAPPFQRLRNIFQTSLALFTYPCCVHSRFEHSLGAATVASRMIAAIQQRTGRTDQTSEIETRLAALLHDLGHGPFSHSSERFYEQLRGADGKRVFEQLARQEPLFADASASEIVAYLLITTPSFHELWERIVQMYSSPKLDLKSVDLERVATMILGVDDRVGPEKRFYRQIVNGPFDADKLDYLPRDGYFTGLEIVVDIERLLHTITVAEQKGENDIAVVASGSSVLEQVLFAKTQLYSSVYHHHKVRAAHQLLMQLFGLMSERSFRPGGLDLNDPLSYVMLDDYDFLHAIPGDAEVDAVVSKIKGRVLPKRALAISYSCFGTDDFESRLNFDKLFDPSNDATIRDVEMRIASELGLKGGEVIVDVPDLPRLGGTGQTLVQLGKNGKDNVLLQDIYPAGAWAKAYAGYRKVAYVFTTVQDEKRRKVGNAARQILSELKYPIKLNNQALELAKC